MKKTITETMFVEAFDYVDNFSRKGLRALYEALIDYEESTGEEVELDVIRLRCEYAEYQSALEVALECGKKASSEEEALEYLRENTFVIEFDGGVIIQNF
jgi:hypothetical protein